MIEVLLFLMLDLMFPQRDYEGHYLLGHTAMYRCRRSPTFWRKALALKGKAGSKTEISTATTNKTNSVA
jgi:hypothetical protein